VSRSTRALLTIAQTGQAHLFFGLLYESVVRIPDRLSSERVLAGEPGEQPTLRSVLRPGSPALYFLPGGPVTLAAAVGAAAIATTGRSGRRWSIASAAATLAFAAPTAGVFQKLNDKLFMAPEPPGAAERTELLRRWYRLNAVRLAIVAIAWASAQRARSSIGGR
jgi:hypothetical protein